MVYEFSNFQVDLLQRILMHDGEPVSVTRKVFDLLALFVQSGGRILQREELIGSLWPDSFVEEGNLSQNIFVLRRILRDDCNGNGFIETIPRQGYRFVAPVIETVQARTKNGLPQDYWSSHSPFRSLKVFETEDAWLFFGRDSEVGEMLGHLNRSSVLAIIGNSGSGKSSLLRAGLIPALQAGRFSCDGSKVDSWRIAVFRPGASPFECLAETLPQQLAPELELKEREEFIAECRDRFRAGGETLRNAVCALARPSGDKIGPTHVLLVADQFEEIFTLTTDPELRKRYIDALLAAARPDSTTRVHLVLGLRADFYGLCLEHAGLSRCLATNLYNIPRMTNDRLHEAIDQRLRLAAVQTEPGLIDSLLEDAGSEPGNLALLEHALAQVWETAGGYACKLTNQAYSKIGRLRGALGRQADSVYEGLGDETDKQLAQRIFFELVHLGEGGNVQDTRRRLLKADLLALAPPDRVERVLGKLVSGRLIFTGREGEEVFVEVSHEALIREWPRLREWLVENREELRQQRRLYLAAEEWHSLNRDSGALLQGARLARAEEWVSKTPDAPPLVRSLLEASSAARDEAVRKEHIAQKRKVSRRRWFSCTLATLLLIAAGAACFAYRQQVIQSRVLAAQSGELLSRDHGQAPDLAIRSLHVAKTEEAYLAVAKAFARPAVLMTHEGPVIAVSFSSDGRRILSTSYDNTARIWNADDGSLLAILHGHTDKIEDAEFSPNGQHIVTASGDHTARVWNSADGRLLTVLQGHTGPVWQVAFSPDGNRILTASWDKTARLWDAADGRLLAILSGHSDRICAAQFSPDGRRIVTASWDKTARLWNAADGRLLAIMDGHSDKVYAALFSPDGQRIVTASDDHTLRVWGGEDGRFLWSLRGHTDRVWQAAFSPDGKRIASVSWDKTVRLWNVADGRLLASFQGHSYWIASLAFSHDGQRIITASGDQTARVWQVLTLDDISQMLAK